MDLKRWLLALVVLLGLWGPISAAPAHAALPPGNAVKDPTAILRNALPMIGATSPLTPLTRAFFNSLAAPPAFPS